MSRRAWNCVLIPGNIRSGCSSALSTLDRCSVARPAKPPTKYYADSNSSFQLSEVLATPTKYIVAQILRQCLLTSGNQIHGAAMRCKPYEWAILVIDRVGGNRREWWVFLLISFEIMRWRSCAEPGYLPISDEATSGSEHRREDDHGC